MGQPLLLATRLAKSATPFSGVIINWVISNFLMHYRIKNYKITKLQAERCNNANRGFDSAFFDTHCSV